MNNPLTINVIGLPAPQGSKRAFVVNGRPVMAESSKKVKPWRQDVAAAAQIAAAEHWRYECPTTSCTCGPDEHLGWHTPAGPVHVEIRFYLPRPRYHYGTGRNANRLKQTAPAYVDKKPDLDKLIRATCDALTTAGTVRDDAQIVGFTTSKRYADAATGARIVITDLAARVDDIVTAASEQGVLL